MYIKLRGNWGLGGRQWRSFLPLKMQDTHIHLPLLLVRGISGADQSSGAAHPGNENPRFSSSLPCPCLCYPDSCALCLNYLNALVDFYSPDC